MGQRSDAVAVLEAGGLAVLPTETVYGLSVALSAGAAGLERIRQAKGSQARRPWILLAADEESAFALWTPAPAAAVDLASRAWPGPLTLVGPAREGLPEGLLGTVDGTPTVSVRVPGDPWLRQLLETLGEPIVSTSANRVGAPPPVHFEDVELGLLAPDLAVDRGRCLGGVPSTIVEVVSCPPRLLRAGAWPWPPE
jgi:L-threonylcarbamoyladenylate synthase